MDPDPRTALEGGNHLVGHGPQLLPDALTVLSRHEDLQPVVRQEKQKARKSGDVVKYVKHRPTIMPFARPVKRTGFRLPASGVRKKVNGTATHALFHISDALVSGVHDGDG
jgi:hypothetical protein